jgi:hypothetical protein
LDFANQDFTIVSNKFSWEYVKPHNSEEKLKISFFVKFFKICILSLFQNKRSDIFSAVEASEFE